MSSPAFIPLFLLLISTPLILQIHARDSQFFNKVTTTQQTQAPTQTVVPDKEKEQQPEFVPQNENGYGIYGHETGLNAPESQPPSTYSSEDEKYYENNNDKDGAFTERFGNGNGEGETLYSNNGEKFETSSFNTEKDDLLNFDDSNNNNGVGTELGQTETETYYKGNNEIDSRYKAYRGEPDAERKGMSDTRFVENGKYYYDLEEEKNGRGNRYDNRGYESSDEVVGNREYDGVSYDNSGAEKYEFNSMEEYEKSRLNQYDP